MTIWSGILAFLSAGTITSVVVKYLGNEVLQIIAAALALSSSILSLFMLNYYTVEDTNEIFKASSKYFALSNKIHLLLINPKICSDNLYENLAQIIDEYTLLNDEYSKYDLFRLAKKEKIDFVGKTSDGRFIGYGTLLESDYYRSKDIYTDTVPGQIPKSLKKIKNVTKAVDIELQRLNAELDRLTERS